MALLRSAPHQMGDIVELRGPRDEKLLVHAPDGLELRIPAPSGRARLWLAQAGTWQVRWGVDGEVTEIEVAPGEQAEDTAPAGPVADPFTYKPGRR